MTMHSPNARSSSSASKPAIVPIQAPSARMPPGDKAGETATSPLRSPDKASPKSGGHGSPRSGPRSPNLPELKFVVVGSRGSGKSTFIQRALDLKRPASSSLSCKKMSLEGQVFLINLVEVQLEEVQVLDDERIRWPSTSDSIDLGSVDGVLALYDVTKQESLQRIPGLLNACSKNAMPCVLVSCKCDAPLSSRKIDPQEVEHLCMEETGIEVIQTSVDSSETHKRCISIVLRNFISERTAMGRPNGATRPRAMTATHIGASSARPQGKRAKHGRAASELATSTQASEQDRAEYARDQAGKSFTQSKSRADAPENPIPPVPESSKASAEYDDSAGDYSRHNRPGGLDLHELPIRSQSRAMPGTPTTIANSFIDFAGESSENEELAEQETRITEPDSGEQASNTTGVAFEELVDRLLAQPISKADTKFQTTFLCLYRKFAAPSELFAAVLQRFEAVQKSSMPQLLIVGAQLRYLAILAQWVAEYPGDFAHPFLRTHMTDFVKKTGANRMFAVAASEMSAHLEAVVEDDDTNWACSDRGKGRTGVIKSLARVPSMTASMTALLAKADASADDWADMSANGRADSKDRLQGHSKTSSTVSSLDRTTSVSGSSMSAPLNSVEAAQRQAELLTPSSRTPLTKLQWHQFMDMADEDIAREMTRIDWILYSAIRPRDLIRHVSLSADQKEQCRGLEYVNRMINQFNHVAFWVTSMVLLRDKAKHRARALEKFMAVAWKLRQLNNYNALGAILAGINGTAVHRLLQTRELVPTQAQKDFMRLEILMGTQRSHFAYRLAWENTMSERIPFLPLHRRDLVSAEEGNRTFVGDNNERINWAKFEVMGDVIVGIRESQGTPYPHIHRNPDAQRLLLEGKFSKDEDELYERSVSLEGPGANEPRRRFNWFQR